MSHIFFQMAARPVFPLQQVAKSIFRTGRIAWLSASVGFEKAFAPAKVFFPACGAGEVFEYQQGYKECIVHNPCFGKIHMYTYV